MNQVIYHEHDPGMKSFASQHSASLTIYGFFFLISIGLSIFFISWLLNPSFSVPPVNGWALVCFYLAMGCLSVGMFGLLSFLFHHSLRHKTFSKEWKLGVGAFLLTGLTFYVFLTLLDAGNIDVFTKRLSFLTSSP
ncbi:MAG: hypothetical protein NPIRA02_36010 [Nitrospirales bacterium]|nr:MAG: hypothetical protein NPIRA02_36010 [Nitrospirales bacterium]